MNARIYIALLRAINVGGSSVMTMANLKTQFEGILGVQGTARTWNVVRKLVELAGRA
jgi:uncharacterized protein (DUF1697 family)